MCIYLFPFISFCVSLKIHFHFDRNTQISGKNMTLGLASFTRATFLFFLFFKDLIYINALIEISLAPTVVKFSASLGSDSYNPV